jgi:dipeptide/tripeptide permease
MPNHDHSEKEYFDTSANMRQYANMRFAQLTLTVAATGALIATLAGHDKPVSDDLATVLKTVGVIVALVFWVMEERAADYWHHFANRAVSLEQVLGFEQYSRRPVQKLFTATNAARLLYFGVLALWAVALASGRRFL